MPNSDVAKLSNSPTREQFELLMAMELAQKAKQPTKAQQPKPAS